MTKVSVIVPVYNTEKYLKKCLDSLVNQSLKDIEIIIVNDGSLDNSQNIIDEYASKYSDIIKSYKKKNGGLSDARNYGLKKATGEYIGFVDSDDFAELDMFEKLYKKAIFDNFDIVACDIKYIFDNHSKVVSSLVEKDIFKFDDIKKQMINIYPAAWNKIYKRNLFKKINFKKNVWYEDVEFLYRLFPYINSIGVVGEPLINYVQRDGAITHTFNDKIYDYIDNWNGIVDFYKKNNLYNNYFEEIEFCYVRYLYMTFVRTATKFKKSDFNKACLTAKKNVLNNFPNYKKNKYLKGFSGFYLKHYDNFFTSLIYFYYYINRFF